MMKHTFLFALAAAVVAGGIGACSSSNNNSTSTSKDAGSPSKDAGDASTNGNDAGSTNQQDASTNQDAGATNDAGAADDGSTANEDSGSDDTAICNVPSTPPSGGTGGSCTGLITGDAGSKELDAGLDDAGNASRTTCNPVTNDGCTGTDICYPDNSNTYYVCFPSTGYTVVNAICGDCTSETAFCAPGSICVGYSSTSNAAACWKYCCTDADCGGTTGSCTTQDFQNPLPNGVGVCSTE